MPAVPAHARRSPGSLAAHSSGLEYIFPRRPDETDVVGVVDGQPVFDKDLIQALQQRRANPNGPKPPVLAALRQSTSYSAIEEHGQLQHRVFVRHTLLSELEAEMVGEDMLRASDWARNMMGASCGWSGTSSNSSSDSSSSSAWASGRGGPSLPDWLRVLSGLVEEPCSGKGMSRSSGNGMSRGSGKGMCRGSGKSMGTGDDDSTGSRDEVGSKVFVPEGEPVPPFASGTRYQAESATIGGVQGKMFTILPQQSSEARRQCKDAAIADALRNFAGR